MARDHVAAVSATSAEEVISVPCPDGASVGDVLVAGIGWNNSAAGITLSTPPPGWTAIGTPQVNSTASLNLYRRVSDGSVLDDINARLSGFKDWGVTIDSVPGINAASIVNAFAFHTDPAVSGTHAAPVLSVTGTPGAFILEGIFERGNTQLYTVAGLTLNEQATNFGITSPVIIATADGGLKPAGSYGGNIWTSQTPYTTPIVITWAVYLTSVASVAPTANAGPDVIDKEPYDLHTFDFSGSHSNDGGTLAYAVSSPGLTFDTTNPIFPTVRFPGSATAHTYTITLTVTDSKGPTATDTMTVAVLPNVNYYADSAGVWQPCEIVAL